MSIEGGSPGCCAAAPGSTTRITAAPPSGTATTRATPTTPLVSVPAVSPPQHPSSSELLEGIPAGVQEGSTDPRVQTRSGDRPRPARRSAQQRPAAPRPHDPGAGWLFVLKLVTVQPLRPHLWPRVRCTLPRVRPSHSQPGTNKKRPAKPASQKASEGKAFGLKTQTPIATPPV